MSMAEKRIGNVVTELRKANNLTQQELANLLNVSKPCICQWEADGTIKTENLYEISKLFHIDVEDLINNTFVLDNSEKFLEDKFSLDKYDYFVEIRDDDYKVILEILDKLKVIKEKFEYLLGIYLFGKINRKQMFEFSYLVENCIELNIDYKSFSFKGREKHFGIEFSSMVDDDLTILKEELSDNSNQKEWEYKKDSLIRLSTTEIFDYKNILKTENEKIIQKLLDILNQVEKDELLTSYISDCCYMTSKDFERSSVVKMFIDSGARCLFSKKSFVCCRKVESDLFDCLTNVVLNQKKTNAYSILLADDNVSEYSFEEYSKIIDYEKTSYLKNLYENKIDNPKQYFEKLLNQNNQSLRDENLWYRK